MPTLATISARFIVYLPLRLISSGNLTPAYKEYVSNVTCLGSVISPSRMHAGILDQYPTSSEEYEFDRVRRATRHGFAKNEFMAQHIAAERV